MRMRLVESAMLVFARRGAEGGVIDEVISTAGVSRGSFYNHFRTNEELLASVAEEVGNQMLAIVDPIVRGLDDPAERVAAGVRLVLEVATQHPQLAAFLARVGPPALDAQSLATEYLPRDIAQGMASGRFAERDPRVGFDLITGPMLAAFYTVASSQMPPGYPEALAEAILLSLGLPKAAARRLARLPLPEIVLPAESLLVRAQARAAELERM